MSIERKKSAAAPGWMEYLLLSALLLVVVVTAWTLIDNGIVDTLASLVAP